MQSDLAESAVLCLVVDCRQIEAKGEFEKQFC